jgi:hypothetical protein
MGEFLSGVLERYGVEVALLAFLVIAQFVVNWRLVRGRLADRQAEINRLAAENRQYREMFKRLIDERLDLKREQSDDD